ncbi:MAG: hypothetical protein IKF19_05035 [Bacilli bacterium]|nr:hypothetical protein [Bacilli bacterium]
MYELIDENNSIKMMALIICTFNYGNVPYCLYSIDRDDTDTNIFVSKLVENSQGCTLDNNFKSGEKEALEDIIMDFLNKTSLDNLKEQGFIINDLKLNGISKFNEKKCYITTYNKSLLKECMFHYGLEVPNDDSPIVEVKKSKPINKGNYESILLIALGIMTIVICIFVIIKIMGN